MEQAKVRSDALVFFGAAGDLAYKKIFPALQAIARRGRLDFPVVGVARAGWTREQLIDRARASVTDNGGFDREAFPRLAERLHYVDGQYADPATFARLREELNTAARPAHYLAIPPSMFPSVIQRLSDAGCTRGARVIIEKPFGRDLQSARELNAVLHEAFPEDSVFRIDHYLGKEAVQNILYFRFRERVPRAGLESALRRERPDHDGRELRREGTRQVLRRNGRDSRRHPESPPSDRQLSGHGSPVLDDCRGHPRRAGQGAAHGAADQRR